MDTKVHEWKPTTRRTIQNDRTFVSVRVHSWFKLSHSRHFHRLVGFIWQRYIPRMDYRDIITIEPGKRSGKPCIRGMRMTVTDVLEYLASGMTHAEILADFPDLTETDIRACLAFAADRERRLATLPG